MTTLLIHGGIDYHQNTIQAAAVDKAGNQLMNRRLPSCAIEAAKAIGACGDVQSIAIESCCGAAEFAEELNAITGWSVTLAHPGYVNRMKLNPDKTDYSDARLLADLDRVGYIPKVWLAPREIRELRSLVRRRQGCVDQQKVAKLRLTSLLRTRRIKAPESAGSRWSLPWMYWIRTLEATESDRWVIDELLNDLTYIKKQVQRAEVRLRRVTRKDRMVKLLQTIPDIGPVTAWVIRAEIAIASRFRTGKQMSRFCGVSPRNCSSGERVADSGMIRAGNPQLKTVIIQLAHRVRRHSRRWGEFAERLEQAGKPSSVIVGAVANRWVRWLFHRMREFEATIHEDSNVT